MFTSRTANWLIIVFLMTVTTQVQGEHKELTLEECIIRAIKHNLDLAVEVLNPELAAIRVSQAQEKFLPLLSLNFNQRNTNSSSYSWIESTATITTKKKDYGIQVDQLIPTGGQFSVSLDSTINDSNQRFQTINPWYQSILFFSFTQPLLKDFGFKTSRKEILLAQNNREISENEYRRVLLETIYSVEESYWNLVYSLETLKARKQSLQLARDLLEKNRKEVEIGTLAPKEILSAQAEVAAREADILQAESLVKDYSDLLKTLINIPREERSLEIIPVDKPSSGKKEMSLEEALAVALQNRSDLQSSKLDIKNKELELGFARNQLLPSLNLSANYWSPGLSGDQILYLDDNPFTGIIVGTIPAGARDALKDAMNFKYRNWSLNLTLDIPLNSVISRAAHAQAKVNHKQAEARLESLEQKTYLEISTAVRAVETNSKRVEAYRIARELAEQKLEAEEAKLRAGLTTNFVVLQYQRDLANAKISELKAIIDYNLSLSQLDKTMGVSLETWNISFTDGGYNWKSD